MKRLFLVLFVTLVFAVSVWAQPVNPVGELVFDTLTYSADVDRTDVQNNEASYPSAVCLHDVLNGETRAFYLDDTILPGQYSFRVRVWYNEITVTNPDGSTTVHTAGWSDYSNIVVAIKPQMLALSIVDGFLVTAPQAGIVATKIYSEVGGVGNYYDGIVQPSPDGQWTRIYDVTGFPAGTFNLWATATIESSDGSRWEGDYQPNPYVVQMVPTRQAPARFKKK